MDHRRHLRILRTWTALLPWVRARPVRGVGTDPPHPKSKRSRLSVLSLKLQVRLSDALPGKEPPGCRVLVEKGAPTDSDSVMTRRHRSSCCRKARCDFPKHRSQRRRSRGQISTFSPSGGVTFRGRFSTGGVEFKGKFLEAPLPRSYATKAGRAASYARHPLACS